MTTLGAMLYGLSEPASLAASAGYWPLEDGFDHSQCDPSVFCRNPLHPGPCKGWKKKLGVIAPGALTAIEKAHGEKVALKRAARIAAKSEAEKIVATGPSHHLAHPLTAKKKTLTHANVIQGDTAEKANAKAGKAILNKQEIRRYSKLKAAQVADLAVSRGLTSDKAKYTAYMEKRIATALDLDNHEGGEKHYRNVIDGTAGALAGGLADKHCGVGSADGDCDGLLWEGLREHGQAVLTQALTTGNVDGLNQLEADVSKIKDHDALKKYLAGKGVDFDKIEAGQYTPDGEDPAIPEPPEIHKKAQKASLAFQKMAKVVNGKTLTSSEADTHAAGLVPVLQTEPHKFDKHAEAFSQGAHLAKRIKDATGVTFGPAEKNKLEAEVKAALAGEGDQQTPLLDAVSKAVAGNDPEGHDLMDAFGIDYGKIPSKEPEKKAGGKPDLKVVKNEPEPKATPAPTPFEKGEKTKMDKLAKVAADQDKANAGAEAVAKLAEMTTGKKLNDKGHALLVAGIAKHQADGQEGGPLEKNIDVGVEKIAAKTKQLTGQDLSPDQQEALAKELKDALNGKGDGKTPILDEIKKEWGKTSEGLYGPGGKPAEPELSTPVKVANVLNNPFATGPEKVKAIDDLTYNEWQDLAPEVKAKAKVVIAEEAAKGNQTALEQAKSFDVPTPGVSKPLGAPKKGPGPTAVPTPAVSQIGNGAGELNALQQEAVALATGAKSGTAKMHVATFEKLTPEEFGQLSPTTQKLIMTKLDAAEGKFKDPKKKAAVKAIKDKLSVGTGGGAGAGGSGVGAPATPAVAAPKSYAQKGQAAADFVGESHDLIGMKPSDESLKATSQVLANILENSPNDPVIKDLADNYTDTLLTNGGLGIGGFGDGELEYIAEPLSADVLEKLKASGAPTPVYDAWKKAVQSKGTSDAHTSLVDLHNLATDWHTKNGPAEEEPDALQALMDAVPDAKSSDQHISEWTDSFDKLRQHATGSPTGEAALKGALQIVEDGFYKEGPEGFTKPGGTAELVGHALGTLAVKKVIGDLGMTEQVKQQWISSGFTGDLHEALSADYTHAMAGKLDAPTGIAAKIDDIITEVNDAEHDLAVKNGWPTNSIAGANFKRSLFEAKVKDLLASAKPAGSGGGTTAPNPAVSTAPPAPPAVPNLAKVDIPNVAETPEGEEPVLGQGDGIGHIPQAAKTKFGVTFHKLPVGTSSSDPIENVYDNLLAVAGWHGSDPEFGGPISILQAAQMLDEAKAKKYGGVNKNLIEKKLISWLGTTAGKDYAEAYTTPNADIIDNIQHPEKALPQEKVVILAPGLKVQELAGGPGPYDPSLSDSHFKKFTKDQARASQDAYMDKAGEPWTAGQKAALKAYTGSSYVEINDYLRGVTTNPSPTVVDRAKKIQAGMRPMTENQLLVRGSSYKVFPEGFRNIEGVKKLIGQEIQDDGFVSATVGGETGSFSKKIKLHIQAPIGTMAAHVQHISSHPKENETILPAGTKYRIISVDESGTQPIVTVRVIS